MFKLKLKSRLLLPLLGLILSLGLLVPKQPANSASDPRIIHVLNRITYGISPGDIEKVQSMGIDNYISSQLSPNSIPQSPRLQQQLNQFDTFNLNPAQLFAQYQPPPGTAMLSEEERKKASQHAKVPFKQARQAHLLRSLYSPQQLQEVMVDFWFNHFNVFVHKGQTRLWIGDYETQAIRPYALGSFRDLLGATAHHPAMLFYLDNEKNTAPNSPGARGAYRGLNENYARELMELHTLGVNGGYSQEDVITLARILTGWSIDRQGKNGDSGFHFAKNRHDFSDKVFLGHHIQGVGKEEGEQALDILAKHPSTARYISYKLAQYFVADQPPSSLVELLAQRFQATDGDIRAVLTTLLTSSEFWDTQYYGAKFKTPYQYVISAVRATGVQQPKLPNLWGILGQLGMQPYTWETPDGYKNTQDAWLNPDAMLRRVSFAMALGRGYASEDPPPDAQQLANTLGNNLSSHTQQVIASSPKYLRTPLILGSPEMMKK